GADVMPLDATAVAGPLGLSLFGHLVEVTVWDVFGVIAQVAFTWRVMHQWVVSEREGKSVLPLAFWSWSLVGSAFDLAYCLGHRPPVLTAGAPAPAPISARTWWLARGPQSRPPKNRWLALPLVAGVLAYLGVVLESFGPDHGLVRFDRADSVWLVIGFVGT